jgi:hypothetical protein
MDEVLAASETLMPAELKLAIEEILSLLRRLGN